MINPNKVGLVIAALIGGWHLVWAALVALGWAQPLIDFIFRAHMIQPVYVIGPFDAGAAGTLLVITFVWGYIVCWDSPLGQGRRPRDASRQGCVMVFCAL